LRNYLNAKNILSKYQFGFRQNHSTYIAIADMCDKISASIDRKEFSAGIFIDLSKAFDTLDHDILLGKLEHYGIRGIVLSWFRSYLQCRKQYVCMNGTSSIPQTISCGVPQGSILGPLLFILYVNDIANCSNILRFILFADDTNLFYSNKNIVELMYILNTELQKLSMWFCVKTKYILFGYKHIPKDKNSFALCLDTNVLERVENIKFLGVHIDCKLNWKKHITHIQTKIAKGLGIMTRVRFILPRNVMLMLYHTLIYPYLVYCNIVWGSAKFSALNKLLLQQKRAVRLCTGSHFRQSSSPLFKRLRLLKINEINRLHTAIFMFRLKNNMLPISCIKLVTLPLTKCTYETRTRHYFKIENYRTCIRELSIAVRGPKLWDSLPNYIKNLCTIGTFKMSLTALYISC
jgi:hypothetical protein